MKKILIALTVLIAFIVAAPTLADARGHRETCSSCGGSGECWQCVGKGYLIEENENGNEFEVECDVCYGSGNCPLCGGTGEY